MRVYVPATLDLLARWLADQAVPWPPEAIVAAADDEESEYAALMAAADESAALLDGPGRRVVVVAEVAGEGQPIPMRLVVAAHADISDFTDPDEDLAWFATQEIPDLV